MNQAFKVEGRWVDWPEMLVSCADQDLSKTVEQPSQPGNEQTRDKTDKKQEMENTRENSKQSTSGYWKGEFGCYILRRVLEGWWEFTHEDRQVFQKCRTGIRAGYHWEIRFWPNFTLLCLPDIVILIIFCCAIGLFSTCQTCIWDTCNNIDNKYAELRHF